MAVQSAIQTDAIGSNIMASQIGGPTLRSTLMATRMNVMVDEVSTSRSNQFVVVAVDAGLFAPLITTRVSGAFDEWNFLAVLRTTSLFR